MLDLLSQAPAIDIARLHGFADRLARVDAEDAYRASAELLSQFLSRLTAGAARGALDGNEIVAGEGAAMQRLAARADPARWAGLRSEIERSFVAADELNLDRKQTVLGAFFAIAEMSR